MDNKTNFTQEELQILYAACMNYGNQLSEMVKSIPNEEKIIVDGLATKAKLSWQLAIKITQFIKYERESPEIIEARYISIWDEERIETFCKVNTATKEVFDIEQSNYAPDGICEGEYVVIDGEEYEVVVYDDAENGDYWRY